MILFLCLLLSLLFSQFLKKLVDCIFCCLLCLGVYFAWHRIPLGTEFHVGSMLDAYISPGERASFREEIAKQGYVKDYEMTIKRKDGVPRSCLVTAVLVRDNHGNITAYRGIIRDITEQKKMEQRLLQAQKMEAIGTLAGGIAHDFNNILAIIMGQGEFIYDEVPEGVEKIAGPRVNIVRESAESIINATERGAALVKRILTFSRHGNPSQTLVNLSETKKWGQANNRANNSCSFSSLIAYCSSCKALPVLAWARNWVNDK